MSNLNDNLDKAKTFVEDTAKKARASETYNKVKDTANEVTQKIKDTETVAGAIDKINQNEYVKKVNKSKYSKLIKICAVAIALVVIYNLFFFIFGDKKAKKAQDFLISQIELQAVNENIDECNVEAKIIGKNEDASMYAFDTIVNAKYMNQKAKTSSYIVIYYDEENEFNSYTVGEYEYEKENKRDMKDIALAKLAKG